MKSSLYSDSLVCCYRSFIIIKGIARLFHKHLKVPCTHFKRNLAPQHVGENVGKSCEKRLQLMEVWRAANRFPQP